VENTNVIYLRYKGRETGFPPAGARRNYVSTRVRSLPPSLRGCLRKKRKRPRRGWLLREVRRSGESKKYYIINTDPRVQWGCSGCLRGAQRQPPATSFCRFSNHPSETTPRALRARGNSTLSPSLAFIQLSLCPPAAYTLSRSCHRTLELFSH